MRDFPGANGSPPLCVVAFFPPPARAGVLEPLKNGSGHVLATSQCPGDRGQLRSGDFNIELVCITSPAAQHLYDIYWDTTGCHCGRSPDPKTVASIFGWVHPCCLKGCPYLRYQLCAAQWGPSLHLKQWAILPASNYQVCQQSADWTQRNISLMEMDRQ